MRTPKPILSIKAVVATALLRESLQSWLVTGLDHRIKPLEVYISALTEKINERKVLIYEKEELVRNVKTTDSYNIRLGYRNSRHDRGASQSQGSPGEFIMLLQTFGWEKLNVHEYLFLIFAFLRTKALVITPFHLIHYCTSAALKVDLRVVQSSNSSTSKKI